MVGQLVKFSDYSVRSDRTGSSSVDEVERSAKPKLHVAGASDHQAEPARSISIDELYNIKEALTRELSSALELLATCAQRIREATDAWNDENRIASDDAMQRLIVLLPESFSCRGLGDGFGAIVNATFHGLRNLEGIPPSKEQIEQIGQLFVFLRSQPFLTFETAVEQITKLEDRGLKVEPAGFDDLTELLSE